MITIPGVSPILMWIGFIIIILILLAIDLIVFNRKEHEISVKEALSWTAVWIALALLFNLFIWLEFGSETGLKFLAGYLLEKSLSVDNIFVIFMIFLSFKIAPIHQHRILFWGIIGALIMRGLLISIGSALIQRFEWIFLIFGIFLVYSGSSMFFKKDEKFDPHQSFVVKFINRFIPVAKKEQGGKFIVREKGKIAITIFLVTLIVIEFTDVIFAFDSIPAIFGITTDPFIVFTSNIFAILGLRSLYFVVVKLNDIFAYLNYGLAFILIFIGVKMMMQDFVHINLGISLGIVFLTLFVSILASIVFARRKKQSKKN